MTASERSHIESFDALNIETDTDTEMQVKDEPLSSLKRTRRRRRRRGGGRRAADKVHWWPFAPHPKDEEGKAIKAGEFGYPVVLPSGQSVFLLHEAKNPEYAQTFLAEDKYRPAMPSPPAAITEDASSDDLTSSPSCRSDAASTDDTEDLWDDVDDSASICSELSTESAGLPGFFGSSSSSAPPGFRERISSLSSLDSDLGASDVSDAISFGASSVEWSSSSSSVSSFGFDGSVSFASFYESICVNFSGVDRVGRLDDASFLAQYSDEVDRLTQDASETNESTDALASRQARREQKRLRKLQEAEARRVADRNQRRAEHEKRERRNKAKQQRREAKASMAASHNPRVDEIDAALRELGFL